MERKYALNAMPYCHMLLLVSPAAFKLKQNNSHGQGNRALPISGNMEGFCLLAVGSCRLFHAQGISRGLCLD